MRKSYSLSISRPIEDVFSCGLFDCVEYCRSKINDEEGFEEFKNHAAQIGELSRQYGVAVRSFHLPFAPTHNERFEPAALREEIRDISFENTKRALAEVIPLGIRYVIIHGSARISPLTRSSRLDLFVEYVQRLCDYLKPYGITLAVETLKPSCIGNGLKEHLYIMEHANRDNLGICFDSNHLLNEDNYNFLENAGQYVVTTHFSDFDGIDERHWFPGRGINDWKRITEILERKGFDHPWNFEVSFPDRCVTAEACRTLISEWEALFD
ncbi:MAG: sugar phosphate isomerase/epimerase [Ruminococcaceae bacterium]|nr:sugar phosphate isomerase/epimerase [Oscillospiraceae bacterium]